MFESIGRDPDHDAEGHRAKAAALGLGSLAVGLGLVAGGIAWLATPPVVPSVTVVEVFPELPSEEPEEPPPAAPAPAPAPRGTQAPDPTEPAVPAPVPPPEPPASGPGTAAGPEGSGRCVGADCGPPDGGDGEGGAPGGEGGGTTRHDHDPPVLRRMVDPMYPKAARQEGLGDQRCLARVKIDDRGVPYDVSVEDCPVVFHAATRDAILTWRWEPAKRGKERVDSQIAVGVTYRVR